MRPDPRFWTGLPVCVTGGSGFLGYHLVRQLTDLGAQVRVLTLPPTSHHPLRTLPDVELVLGDVRDPAVVRRAVGRCAVVFHTAGVVAVSGPALARMWSVHVEGTRAVLEASAGARVVHTSSIVAVGATPHGEALDEDSPFNLEGLALPYVHAKRAAEQLALEAAGRQEVVVVNPAYLVGPEDHEGSVMGKMCRRFWRGNLLLAPPGGINLVDVRDVATGHLLAAEHGRAGQRYILGGENHSFVSFFWHLATAAGYRPRALPRLPHWALTAIAGWCEVWARLKGTRSAYPSLGHARLNRYTWFVRSGRAQGELEYGSRSLAETLADAYRWHTRGARPRLRGLARWWLRPVPEVANDLRRLTPRFSPVREPVRSTTD